MVTLPDNLDQVISGRVIDDIINIFFDYVSWTGLDGESRRT